MRKLAAVLVVFVLGGCTSVKMVQRDGCWVRKTEKRLLGTVAEEVGPCARPATAFVENDSLTRLVQECVSRADYRWQMRALAAWDRREPWPEQLSESSVLQQCLDDSARGVLTETAALKDKNAALEKRLLELAQERQAERARMEEERRELVRRTDEERKSLFKRNEEERKDLLALQSKLGDHLGDAAKKIQPLPAPNPAIATATATSEGRSRTEAAEARPTTLAIVPQPGSPVTATATMVPPAAPAAVVCPVPAEPARAAKAAKPAKAAKQVARQARSAPRAAARLPACDPKATAATVAPVSAPAAATVSPSVSPPAAEAAGEKAATAAK